MQSVATHTRIVASQIFTFLAKKNDKKNSHFGVPVPRSSGKLSKVWHGSNNSLGKLKLWENAIIQIRLINSLLDAITDLTNRILLVKINMNIAR